jgi:flagellar biosynthesis/type III secretory pathway M-ring protein FliF/YscJ
MSNIKNIPQYSVDTETFQEKYSWLNTATIWATLILVSWFVVFIGYKIIEAVIAGRMF